jgi:hypothetical protein
MRIGHALVGSDALADIQLGRSIARFVREASLNREPAASAQAPEKAVDVYVPRLR